MTTRQRLEDDEYRDEVEQRLGEIEDKSTAELYELKQSDDPVDSDAAKLEMNRRYADSAGGDSKVRGKVKRGTGTRDQDEIVIEGRGEDADEAADDFEDALERAEEGDWAGRLRKLRDSSDEPEE